MKKVIQAVLIALMLLCMLALIPSAAITGYAEVLELPLDAKAGLPPQEEGFLSENEYEDPSLSVKIERGRWLETNYVIARVKIANASQIRTAMAQSYYAPSTVAADVMSRRVNAVVAMNGDYFSARNGDGYVARQGKVYRTRCYGNYDVLIIDEKGDFHILKKAVSKDIEGFEGTPINGFNFGPGLVIDGERQTELTNIDNGPYKQTQRSCIAQTGPLEYLLLCSEGPDDEGSTGLTMEQFADLAASLNVVNAYNLDGGSSAHLLFRHQKLNAVNNPNRRPLCDIIYFASAYQPD